MRKKLIVLTTGLMLLWASAFHIPKELTQHTLGGLIFPEVEAAYRFSDFKSTQTGQTCTITGVGSTCAITISSVTTGNTLLVPSGFKHTGTAGANDLYYDQGRFVLTNGTTVTITNDAPNEGSQVYFVDVLEYYGNHFTANGVQRGTIALSSAQTSNTATITTTTGAHTAVIGCNFTTAPGTVRADLNAVVVTYANPTVTATRGAQDGTVSATACYQVADFK